MGILSEGGSKTGFKEKFAASHNGLREFPSRIRAPLLGESCGQRRVQLTTPHRIMPIGRPIGRRDPGCPIEKSGWILTFARFRVNSPLKKVS